ncbi:hypothetical protein [Petralouisia muris]|jgi:hypothetical protein|nr:hypothetical protein [Petralouisia muris]
MLDECHNSEEYRQLSESVREYCNVMHKLIMDVELPHGMKL